MPPPSLHDADTPDPRRILLIRPSALGDVCRTVPVLASLKRRFPNAEIDWLVQRGFEGAIRSHPDLHRPVLFDRRRLGRLYRPNAIRGLLGFLRELRSERYDIVIDCQGLFRSGFFARATRAPRRIGDRNAREFGHLFLNERHAIDPSLHTVDRMLGLIEAAGIEPARDMRLHTSSELRTKIIAAHPWLTEGAVTLAPTSRWASKRWPADRFAKLAEHLLAQGTPHIAVVGGPGEEVQCGPLLELAGRDSRVHSLIGKTSVAELLCVIEASRLVVANDSAALHMAVGFDRPIVALFGPTDTARVGPYRRDSDVIQVRYDADTLDHKNDVNGRMMGRIGVDVVASACGRRLR